MGGACLLVRGDWVEPAEPRGQGAVLYLHGSGYAICSARTHRGITTRLAQRTGLPLFAADYRLAPRHRFPSAADDVAAAWEWLVACGHASEQIVIAGDSAGGHLALDLATQLVRSGRRPAGIVLMSPLIDLTFGLARQRERIRRDPMISAARAERLVRHYVRDADLTDPRLSFTSAGLRGLPPVLVQAGGREMLAGDAEHVAELIAAAGGRCELQVGPEQMHVFQAMPRLLPEADRALDHAARFVVERLAPAGTEVGA